MQKNEVYDYLAKIYLDKQPSAKSNKNFLKSHKYALFLIIPIIAIPSLYLILSSPLKLFKPKAYTLYLSTGNELIKISYNFVDTALRKANYTLNLADLDLKDYKLLKFKARHLKRYGSLNLKVELENNFKESASYYIQDLSQGWKGFNLELSNFKEITNWSNIKRLSFVVEEWNVQDKDDCVYIDEIGFVK